MILLKFNGDYMSVDIREPTDELLALGVNWLMPPMESITPQSIQRSRRAIDDYMIQVPGEDNPTPEGEQLVHTPEAEPKAGMGKRTVAEWKEPPLLYPYEDVIEKTLKSTTQLQVEPIESERREILRQHQKQRLLMLHPRRLKGRTDTDTFFSSVKSIRGYLCVQIFCHVLSDFIFVRCMQGNPISMVHIRTISARWERQS